MSLLASRISDNVVIALKGLGFDPDKVPFLQTGKGAIEHIVEQISIAVINEIVQNMEIKGIQVDTDTLLIGPPIVTIQDGGTTLFNGTLKTEVNNKNLIQSNDGTGRVS